MVFIENLDFWTIFPYLNSDNTEQNRQNFHSRKISKLPLASGLSLVTQQQLLSPWQKSKMFAYFVQNFLLLNYFCCPFTWHFLKIFVCLTNKHSTYPTLVTRLLPTPSWTSFMNYPLLYHPNFAKLTFINLKHIYRIRKLNHQKIDDCHQFYQQFIMKFLKRLQHDNH